MARLRTRQLKGGYKAYRKLALESFKSPFKFVILGGSTGSGKTDILRALAKKGEQVIDLEKLANHKGSVFGGLMMPPQPTTEQFQNNLFEEILKLDLNKRIWIEDESIAVGKIFLPEDLWKQMGESPVVEMLVDRETRIERLVNEYGNADKKEFLSCIEKITKKLGGQHFNSAKEALFNGTMSDTIAILLTYYDKAYATGMSKKTQRITHRLSWNGKNTSEFADQLLEAMNYSD